MEIKEFNEIFYEELNKNQIKVENKENFYKFMQNILEWNEKINLTNITEEREFIVKHFIDSLTILKYIEDNKRLIDIGCGAGFPGIPIKLANTTLTETLIDSVN